MSTAIRPEPVILSRDDKANKIIACIPCQDSFVPSNAERPIMKKFPSCGEYFKDDNGLTKFGKSVDEDAYNVRQGSLFISIPLVLFAICIDRLLWTAKRAPDLLIRVKIKIMV